MFLRLVTLTIVAFASFFSSSAIAQISLDNVIIRFAADKRPVHNVIVKNSSEHVTYVTVEVEAMVNPGTDSSYIASTELLASPKAFSVEPHGQRTVRLLLQSPPTNKERVFRVGFVPQDRGFGKEITQRQGGTTTVIRVMTGMGALVFADPVEPRALLEWSRSGDRITFANAGNVNVYLGDGKACASDTDCSELPGKRLYASQSLELTVTPNRPVTYLYHEGGTGNYQRLSVPAGDGNGTFPSSLESETKTN